MTYRWVEHTAELGLELDAATEEDVFRETAVAFGELVGEAGGEQFAHTLSVTGEDRASLLVAWLEELVFLAETEDFVPDRADEVRLGETGVRATLRGRRDAPRHLVKAVTYHGLRFDHDGERWRAYVVLDV